MTELRQSPSGPESDVPTIDDVADGQVPQRDANTWVGKVAATVDKVSDGEVPQRSGAGWSGKVAATVDKVSDGQVAQRAGAGWSGKVAATVDKVSDGQVPQRDGTGWSGKVAATVDKVSDGQVPQRSGVGWAGKVVPSISTTTDGQVPVRSGAGWSSTAAASAFDHVVRTMSDLPAPVGGPPGLINLTAGSWFFAEALNIGNNIIVVPGGVECHLKGAWGKFLTGTSTNLIAVNGAALLETMVLSNDAPLLLSGVGGICHVLESEIIAISTCVLTTIAFGYLQVTGGLWRRFGGTPAGLYLNCNVTRVQLNGVGAIGLTHFIQHVAGTIGECSALGCNSDSSNGVTWLAANMPTRGLALVGNVFNSAAPYNGFTQASARVNCKANVGSAGLLSETAIVP